MMLPQINPLFGAKGFVPRNLVRTFKEKLMSYMFMLCKVVPNIFLRLWTKSFSVSVITEMKATERKLYHGVCYPVQAKVVPSNIFICESSPYV